jgi:ADP-ribose pyrophosphatase YjhB (NUDIX family)
VVPEPTWLTWSRTLQSIAQAGLTYASDEYDIERYTQVRRLAAEIAATHTDSSAERIEGIFATGTGYPTPKVDVRAAVVVSGEILLVRERSDGSWTLPGGWADPGESPSEAVTREVFEEAGVTVKAVKLLALYDRARHGHEPHADYIYKAFFACEPVGSPTPSASGETDQAAYFDPGSLPQLSSARITAAQIAMVMTHHEDPSLPTEFD